MGIVSRFGRNLDLMSRMWRRTGRQSLIASGMVPENAVKAAMVRCAGCDHTDECASWLDAGGSDREPPEFCANRNFLSALETA